MQQIKVLYGRQGVGKSTLARSIAKLYETEEVTFCSFVDFKNPFFLRSCTENTKLLIFDSVKVDDFRRLLLLVSGGIRINKPGRHALIICPDVIIVCQEDILHTSRTPYQIQYLHLK